VTGSTGQARLDMINRTARSTVNKINGIDGFLRKHQEDLQDQDKIRECRARMTDRKIKEKDYTGTTGQPEYKRTKRTDRITHIQKDRYDCAVGPFKSIFFSFFPAENRSFKA
jgi:hypothetical protein